MSKDLTDEELARQLAELTGIKLARDVIKQAAADTLKLERMRALQVALLPLIDILEPEHRDGRYGDICTDSGMSGATRWHQEPKDYRCPRCCLFFFCRTEDDQELLHTYLSIAIQW